jgi:two-component system, NtrC family, nitrogen regulation sensor histidine kinase NtrY
MPRKPTYITDTDRRRQKREFFLIVVIILVVGLLTYAESRIVHFGADFPISNTILMFILININLLLLLLLLILVFRNLVKLLYDRRRKVMGAKLRTRLVLAFITFSLLPTTVLFFFSINFINTSIEFWFSVPVEQALEDSLQVGRGIYTMSENNNLFFIKKISSTIAIKGLLAPRKGEALTRTVRLARNSFNLQAVEVYSPNYSRLTYAICDELNDTPLRVIPTDHFQKPTTERHIYTLFETIPSGELVRSIGTIPFGVSREQAKGFLVVSELIPWKLSDKMAAISRGFEGYQQMKLLTRPIEITYTLSLSIVGLLVVFCAVWFGFYLAKTISIPLKELAEGTRRVADGDLNFSIEAVGDDEIGSLVDAFNTMTRDLKDGREKLEHSARILRTQNLEIEERRQYMEIILRFVSAGVMSLDPNGVIMTMNRSAEKMLGLEADRILNKNFRDLLSGNLLLFAEEVMEQVSTAKEGALELPARITVGGRPRSFLVNANVLKDDTGRPLGIVVVFDDLTTLERAQRMAAWREVARRIAHEVKNPLTPIALSAQRLQRRYAERLQEPVFEECTRMIIEHVALIRNLVNEFSAFSRFPSAHPLPCELAPIIEETIALYREGHEAVRFETTFPESLPLLNLDRQQIKQAMINLMGNALSAIRSRGTIWISVAFDSILNRVRIEVADDGPGIPDEEKVRLFEPYFSTKKTGMGLGLTIVNSIIADHAGTISVQDNQPQGAKFVIELPV